LPPEDPVFQCRQANWPVAGAHRSHCVAIPAFLAAVIRQSNRFTAQGRDPAESFLRGAGEMPILGYIPSMPVDPDRRPAWVPRADALVNSNGEFHIKVELAAMKRGDVELEVEGRRIRIKGRRPDADRGQPGTRYFFAEIAFGEFELLVDVPDGFDLSRSEACYQNGLLLVVVPPNPPADQRW
jgi:HSP20 family molecular chaperone IbpA